MSTWNINNIKDNICAFANFMQKKGKRENNYQIKEDEEKWPKNKASRDESNSQKILSDK